VATQAYVLANIPASAQYAGSAIYATVSASSTNASSAQYSLNSTSATISSSANISSSALYATNSGSSTYATQSGISGSTNQTSFSTLSVNGDLNVSGNAYISGSTFIVSASNISTTDPLIYLGMENKANINDLGIVGSFTSSSYQHTGIVRDHSDGIWKLFSGVTTEPTNVINFASAVYDTLKIGGLQITSSAQVTNLNADLLDGYNAAYFAPISSPSFTGIPLAPTAASNVSNTQIATTAYVNSAVTQHASLSASTGYYGSFYSSTTQTLTSANTPKTIQFNESFGSQGLTLTSGSLITFTYPGVYNINVSAQIEGNGSDTYNIWLRKNGSDIPLSNRVISTSNQNHTVEALINHTQTFNAGDTAQVMWMSTDAAAVLLYQTSTASTPAVPSAILNVNLISYIQSASIVTYAYDSASLGGIISSSYALNSYVNTQDSNYYASAQSYANTASLNAYNAASAYTQSGSWNNTNASVSYAKNSASSNVSSSATTSASAQNIIGTLPVSQGGTGTGSFTSGQAIIGNGSGTFTTTNISSTGGINSIVKSASNGLITAGNGGFSTNGSIIANGNLGSTQMGGQITLGNLNDTTYRTAINNELYVGTTDSQTLDGWAVYVPNGTINASAVFGTSVSGTSISAFSSLNVSQNLRFYDANNPTNYITINSPTLATQPSGILYLPIPSNAATLISTGDSGTVSNSMINSVSASKITGVVASATYSSSALYSSSVGGTLVGGLFDTSSTSVTLFSTPTTINIGTTGTFSSQTRTINIGQGVPSTGAQNINIGSSNLSSATENINIGTGSISTATRNVNIATNTAGGSNNTSVYIGNTNAPISVSATNFTVNATTASIGGTAYFTGTLYFNQTLDTSNGATGTNSIFPSATTATNLLFANANNIAIGSNRTSTQTIYIGAGATTGAVTKNINIGTAQVGTTSSTTITLGSASGISNTNINGNLTVSSSVTASTVIGGGMDLVYSSSFAYASAVSFNNIFTTKYDNYKIIFNNISASNGGSYPNALIRLRASGADLTSGYYNVLENFVTTSGSIIPTYYNASTGWIVSANGTMSSTTGGLSFEIFTPAIATYKQIMNIASISSNPGTSFFSNGNGFTTSSSTYDGITFISGASNLFYSGTIRVYGYHN
jgi:hypothetical protein